MLENENVSSYKCLFKLPVLESLKGNSFYYKMYGITIYDSVQKPFFKEKIFIKWLKLQKHTQEANSVFCLLVVQLLFFFFWCGFFSYSDLT